MSDERMKAVARSMYAASVSTSELAQQITRSGQMIVRALWAQLDLMQKSTPDVWGPLARSSSRKRKRVDRKNVLAARSANVRRMQRERLGKRSDRKSRIQLWVF